MQDKETGTEWSHILGTAMAGKLKGTRLEIIPSEMTNWGSWQMRHPETTVTMIPPAAKGYESEILSDGKRFGLGLIHNGTSTLWRFDHLEFERLVNDEASELPLAVYFDVPSRTPYAWSRTISWENSAENSVDNEPKVLTFRLNAQGVQDTETDSVWDMRAGKATAGPLAETKLEAIPAIVTFTDSWLRFHPNTRVWTPETR